MTGGEGALFVIIAMILMTLLAIFLGVRRMKANEFEDAPWEHREDQP